MELDYAILADKATLTHDRKLVILGGDIDSVTVESLPAFVQMSVVARAVIGPDEPLEGHTFGLECTKVSGERLVVAQGIAINAKRNPVEPSQPAGSRILLDLSIVFSDAGAYLLHLIIDDKEAKRFRFQVVHEPKAEQK